MNLALFDFDGTITRGDTYQPFLRYAVRWPRVAVGIVPMMPVALAYQMGWLSARSARPIASGLSFIGASADAVRDLGRRYATEVLPRTIRPRAVERIRWHQEHGDTVVVVAEEDREMELAHRRYYRWREITHWSEAMAQGVEHPDRAVT